MSLTASRSVDLPAVAGALNYLAPMPEAPFNYVYEPPPGTPRTNAVYDRRIMPIHDARPIADDLSLDREGFALADHHSAVRDFYDEAALRETYYRECEELVAEATGASRVIVFDHTVRRREERFADRPAAVPRGPVLRVHNDFTVKSGPQRVRDLFPDEAEDLLHRRFASLNVWRPIRGPLRDSPLAVCDAASVAFEDFVASSQIYPDRRGETYVVRHNPAHRWFYVPAMRKDEALLIKCYDSVENIARFVPHSAFEDPTTPVDALPRESIETRTIAFFD